VGTSNFSIGNNTSGSAISILNDGKVGINTNTP
jgi:hypothetical protein